MDDHERHEDQVRVFVAACGCRSIAVRWADGTLTLTGDVPGTRIVIVEPDRVFGAPALAEDAKDAADAYHAAHGGPAWYAWHECICGSREPYGEPGTLPPGWTEREDGREVCPGCADDWFGDVGVTFPGAAPTET